MRKLQVINWTDPGIPISGAVPTIWANQTWAPRDAARETRRRTRGLAPEDQVILIGSGLYGGAGIPSWLGTLSFDELLLNGPPAHTEHEQWWAEFWASYFGMGGTVAKVVMDFEPATGTGLSLWSWDISAADRVEMLRKVIEGPARAKLTPPLMSFKAQDFADQFKGAQAWTEWNYFAWTKIAWWMREVVVMTAKSAAGKDVEVFNYGDMRLAYDVRDDNDWPIKSPGAAIGQYSSPALYNWEAGQRYDGRTGAKTDLRFQNLINNQTIYRSCMSTSDKVASWHSYPSFPYDPKNPPTADTITARRWIWRENLMHSRAAGGTCFVHWNQLESPQDLWREDMAFAAKVFAELAAMDVWPAKLAAIDPRSESFATAGVTTHYADYLEAKSVPVL